MLVKSVGVSSSQMVITPNKILGCALKGRSRRNFNNTTETVCKKDEFVTYSSYEKEKHNFVHAILLKL